ncbi:MAG: CobD/CbiB family cobalamin biosynthesis protein [Acidimicrobiia bacterium]
MARRMLGSAAGLGIDRIVGEPPTPVHPVAAFGVAMQRVEAAVYAPTQRSGLGYTAIGVALGAGAGVVLGSTALAVALASAGRMLRARARSIQGLLDVEDVDGARAALPALVGRDPSALDESGIAAAVVESVAENTVDAVVAPALWGAVGGAIGAGAYRAVNTMDAMVGHHSSRYERFGWGSARLDDVAAFVPARLTAVLVGLARPRRWRAVERAVRCDAPGHPSPNAGVAEAAFAGALGVELGGPLRYGARTEDRPRLGDGPRPVPRDIDRAVRLADRVELLLAGGLATGGALALAATGRRRDG